MIPERTTEALAEIMRNAPKQLRSVCMLVGAGASVSAGIPDADAIMDDIKDRYPRTVSSATRGYAQYMSLLPDGVRRELIRNYIAHARLNMSARAVARLVRAQYVDRVLTTNFDPLVERALQSCGCNAGVHDFAATQAFNSGDATGPRVFYLHGRADGFLLLNTRDEIKTLAGKLTPLFDDSNRRRTWVVIGYSGRDEPVFDALAGLPTYDYGLFWVGHRMHDPPQHVQQRILSKRNAFFVRAQDSDSFFASVLQELSLSLGPPQRPKTRVPLEDIDPRLTAAGEREAANLFGVTQREVKAIAYRVLHENTGETHLHRIFITTKNYKLLQDAIHETPPPNIIRMLIEKRGLVLHVRKYHRVMPTTVGQDAAVLEVHEDTPALLHAQVSYAEVSSPNDGVRFEPIELLITKYTSPLSVLGYLLDRTPKEGYAYSKAAEDLLHTASARQEVTDAVQTFFHPLSYLSLQEAEARRGGEDVLPHSSTPQSLLRLVVVPEECCNYRCVFCCQAAGETTNADAPHFTPRMCEALTMAAVKSGCRRIMLTGGEPLLCERDRLVETVRLIAVVDGLQEFWICSNGSRLNAKLCKRLYGAGLRKIVVTVGADSQDRYARYTGQQDVALGDILEKLREAAEAGLHVKVDIPLSRSGIANYAQFLRLVGALESVGVSEVAYFRLHRTRHNAVAFDNEFVPHEIITWELGRDNEWRIVTKEGGQKIFTNEKMAIIVPARIRAESANCVARQCGNHCQGIYAAYARVKGESVLLQACHTELPGNTVPVAAANVTATDADKLADILKSKVWSWAYDRH